MEKLLVPKPPTESLPEENKSAEGLQWKFFPGTNLPSPFRGKIERESKLRLNEFAKEIRSCGIVDMSGKLKFVHQSP